MQTRYTSADQWAEAKDGVIPAPYALEEGEQIIDQYLEPVIFHNVNGPDIGVTTCGVIVKDGLYFKDLDNSGVLAPYKDWRLSPEQRAEQYRCCHAATWSATESQRTSCPNRPQ